MPLRRRPIARMAVGTAVIAGTATAVGGRVARHQEQKYAAQDQAQYEQQQYEQQQYAAQQQQYAPAPAAAAAPEDADPMAQLEKLADLHSKGILTDDEFSAQKAKILSSM